MTEKRSISLALGKTAATSRSRAPQWPRALPGRAKIPARSWRDLGLRWPARACASLRGPRAARRGGGFTGDRISGCAARRRPRELAAAGPRREQERPEPAPTCKPLVYEVPKIKRKIRGQPATNATLLHVACPVSVKKGSTWDMSRLLHACYNVAICTAVFVQKVHVPVICYSFCYAPFAQYRTSLN